MICWGETETRLDPNFYHPIYRELLAKIAARNSFALREICTLSSEFWDQKTGYVENFPYLEISEVDPKTGAIGRIQRVAVEQAASRAKVVIRNGDIIVSTTRPARGAIALVDSNVETPFIASTGFSVVRETKPLVTKPFLLAVLRSRISLLQLEQRSSGGNYPAITASELKRLKIPLPSKEIQNKVVRKYLGAISRYESDLAEADALITSIDDYLLSELGIVLPPEPESTIANRMFLTNAHELGGWRFDPLFHSFKLWHAIETSPTPSAHLGIFCRLAKTGFAAGGHMQLHDDDGIIQIRPTNIGADRQLKFDRNVYLDRSILGSQPTDVLGRREVLFNNTNSQEQVGKTVFFDIEGTFVCSNHITRLATNEAELVPEYLSAVLNAYQRLKVFYSICTNWNNQSGVNVDLLRKLTIPVPSVEKQRGIACEIGKTFDQAISLREEAKAELEKAKAEIEAILLGDSE